MIERVELKDDVASNPQPLPKGWDWAALGELGLVRLGKTPRKSDYCLSGDYKIVKFRDLDEHGHIDWSNDDKGFVDSSREVLTALKELKESDVLVTASAHMSEHIGRKVGIVSNIPSKFKSVYVVGEILQVRVKDGVDPKWVLYYLRSSEGYKAIQRHVHGVHLIASRAQNIEIPLAPLDQQRLIVVEIEKQFSRLDESITNLKRVKANLKRYKATVLKAAVEGVKLGWPEYRLADVCQVISGFAFKSSSFCESGIPAIKIANIGYGEFLWKDQEYLPPSFCKDYGSYVIHSGDVLMALTRPITNGTVKVCRYPLDAPIALLNQRVAVLRPTEKAKPLYLMALLQSALFKEQLEDALSETLQPNLSPVDLKKFTVRMPSVQEQVNIGNEVESKISNIIELEAEVDTNLKRAERLRQSVLMKAFSGGLLN